MVLFCRQDIVYIEDRATEVFGEQDFQCMSQPPAHLLDALQFWLPPTQFATGPPPSSNSGCTAAKPSLILWCSFEVIIVSTET